MYWNQTFLVLNWAGAGKSKMLFNLFSSSQILIVWSCVCQPTCQYLSSQEIFHRLIHVKPLFIFQRLREVLNRSHDNDRVRLYFNRNLRNTLIRVGHLQVDFLLIFLTLVRSLLYYVDNHSSLSKQVAKRIGAIVSPFHH